jgi:site-specific DNA-methyltransferase (adenine-specific)
VIGSATLYLGDCREILPALDPVDALVTDPVWPNVPNTRDRAAWEGWPDVPDAAALLAQMFAAMPVLPKRAVIVIRNDSDPRFLCAVPPALLFYRTQILPYVLPSRIGRKLGGDELAYGFGEPILPYPEGKHLMSGRADPAQPLKANGHPCSRSPAHFKYLIKWWSKINETILDPFMGSATTGEAAVISGRKFVGIELVPRYFDIACARIEQALKQQRLFA